MTHVDKDETTQQRGTSGAYIYISLLRGVRSGLSIGLGLRRRARSSIILLGRAVLRAVRRLLITLGRKRRRAVRGLGMSVWRERGLRSTRRAGVNLGSAGRWRMTRSGRHRRRVIRLILLARSRRGRIRRLSRRGRMLGWISRLAIRPRHDCGAVQSRKSWIQVTGRRPQARTREYEEGREENKQDMWSDVTQGVFFIRQQRYELEMLTEPDADGADGADGGADPG
jgi:hypothetical protein